MRAASAAVQASSSAIPSASVASRCSVGRAFHAYVSTSRGVDGRSGPIASSAIAISPCVVCRGPRNSAKTGTWKAWLNGFGSANTEFVYQTVTIPSTATTATLTFWLRVDSAETTTTQAYDVLRVQVRNGSNTVLGTLATYSNLNETTGYVQRTFDVSAWRGQTVRIYFEGIEGSQVATSFLIDDVSLKTN